MKKLLVGLAAVAGSLLVAVPAAHAADIDVVSVTNEGGVVRVGTQVGDQPLVGGSVNTNDGAVCVGFSYQIPICTAG